MASFTERIKVVLDVESTKIENAFKNLRTKVSEADTTMGKFKAGATGAFQAAQQYAGQLALAGGTALVAFGAKSVMAFQQTALGAGELRDKLGITAEEASRLQEVADDLGIGVGALEKTIGRMNREVENSPERFEALGAAIARNRDGTVNVTQTFLNTVDALRKIPSATERAAKAQELFGRSWQDISELVGMGADGIRKAMASVEDSKIIDDDEVEKARRFRDTLDELKGIFESVTLVAGEQLVPILTDVGETFGDVKSAVDALPDLPDWMRDAASFLGPLGAIRKLGDAYRELGAGLGIGDDALDRAVAELAAQNNNLAESGNTLGVMMSDLAKNTQSTTDTFDLQNSALGAMIPTLEGTADGVNRLDEVQRRAKEAADMHREAIERQRDQVKRLIDANLQLVGGELAVQSAQNQAAEAVANYTETNKDAEASELDKSNAQIQATEAVLGAAQAAVDYQVKQAEANGQTLDAGAKAQLMRDELAKLASTMEPGSPLLAAILGYIQQLDQIPRSVTTELRVTGQRFTSNGGDAIGNRGIGNQAVAGATGGIVTRPTLSWIGESGPEAVIPLNRTPGSSPLPGGLGGSPTIIVNAQGAVGLHGAQVEQWIAEGLERWKRRNGQS
jgi:hypothetical protein